MILPACPYLVCVRFEDNKEWMEMVRWMEDNTRGQFIFERLGRRRFHVWRKDCYEHVSVNAQTAIVTKTGTVQRIDNIDGAMVHFEDSSDAVAFKLYHSDQLARIKVTSIDATAHD